MGEPIDNRLENAINKLKGTNTIIAPYILADNKRFKANSPEGDSEAIKLLQLISMWSKKAGLQVAIYPHFSFYVERTDHALQLAQKKCFHKYEITGINLNKYHVTCSKCGHLSFKKCVKY